MEFFEVWNVKMKQFCLVENQNDVSDVENEGYGTWQESSIILFQLVLK